MAQESDAVLCQIPVIRASDPEPGTSGETVGLPRIFATPFRPDIIHKAFVHLASHGFQPQGRYPMAGMNVVADTNDPPTGRGISRIARAQGGGGRRRGEGAEVASTRGGRQAHPPTSKKVIHKRLNKKEGRLALCSAVAATASRDLIEARGHEISEYVRQHEGRLPIVVDDAVVQCATAGDAMSLIERLGLSGDVERLQCRKARSGKSALRGRSRKGGKSILFVTHDSGAPIAHAVGALPGVDAKAAADLSVLDLAPGASPIRLAVFTKSAIEQLGRIRSTHLDVMITTAGGPVSVPGSNNHAGRDQIRDNHDDGNAGIDDATGAEELSQAPKHEEAAS